MNNKKVYTIIGVTFLFLYFISILMFLWNFQTDIKMQNVQNLKMI